MDVHGSSDIAEFYRGRSVFITGATGFMGKVLVEKLLRACPDIERLYLLMRPSKGKAIASRLVELTNNQVFDALRHCRPDVLDKMSALAGDVTEPEFGLSSDDMQTLLDNVSIVFNLAATVRFDEDLPTAVKMNVNGPIQMLEICRRMKQLTAFVHVSTAFNNLSRERIEEEIYPGDIDPITLVNFINNVDEELIESITKQIVGQCPNTYTFSKALAEQILEKQRGSVPLVIVRPSIVTAALKEPYPGWIDNLNGPSGIIAAGGKGFISVFKREAPNYVTDLIPVDFSINLMIAAAWNTSRHPHSAELPVTVYSSSTSQRNPITFGQFEQFTYDAWMKHPTVDMLWLPYATCTSSNFYYQLNVIFLHLIPAYFVDFFWRTVWGQRPKWVRLYRKVFKALSGFDYFFSRQWLFVSENPAHLWSKLSIRDQQVFYFDVTTINWRAYFELYILGVRRFILKDDPTTLPQARIKLKKLYVIRTILRLMSFIAVILGVPYFFNTIRRTL